MKNISVLISALFIISVSINSALAQKGDDKSFQKGAMVTDLTANFGIYSTTGRDNQTGKTTTDAAAAGIYALGFEYGIMDWLGAGLKLRYNSYVTSKDTGTGYTPTVSAFDALLNVNAHVLRGKHFNLPVGFAFGYSNISFLGNDPQATRGGGGGVFFDFHVDPRIYFGEHFGINFHVAYAYYNYSPISFTNNTITNAANSYTGRLSGSGANIGIGFQYKF